MGLDIDALGEDVGLFDAIRSCRHIRRLKPDPVPEALVRKVCEVTPPDVRQLNQDVDSETADILECMMAKKREVTTTYAAIYYRLCELPLPLPLPSSAAVRSAPTPPFRET